MRSAWKTHHVLLYFFKAWATMTFLFDMVDMEMVHMDMVDMDMVDMDMVGMDLVMYLL